MSVGRHIVATIVVIAGVIAIIRLTYRPEVRTKADDSRMLPEVPVIVPNLGVGAWADTLELSPDGTTLRIVGGLRGVADRTGLLVLGVTLVDADDLTGVTMLTNGRRVAGMPVYRYEVEIPVIPRLNHIRLEVQ